MYIYIYIFPNTTGMFRNFRILWASEKAQRLLFWTEFFGLQGSKPKILPWRKIWSIHICSSSYKSYKCIVIKYLHNFIKMYTVLIFIYIYILNILIYTLKISKTYAYGYTLIIITPDVCRADFRKHSPLKMEASESVKSMYFSSSEYSHLTSNETRLSALCKGPT